MSTHEIQAYIRRRSDGFLVLTLNPSTFTEVAGYGATIADAREEYEDLLKRHVIDKKLGYSSSFSSSDIDDLAMLVSGVTGKEVALREIDTQNLEINTYVPETNLNIHYYRRIGE